MSQIEMEPDFSRAGMVLWPGRSGRRYSLVPASGEGLALAPGRLYVLAVDGVIRWAGSAGDLIADQTSRARYRGAVAAGAQMFSMPAPEDELALMTLVWDLEGTRRIPDRTAA